MSLTEQSLLHNLSVNDKGKLTWNSSYDLLRKFVDEVLNLPNEEWSSPGGDAKLFESEGVPIRWYAKAKTITLNGRCQSETEEKLYSIASISKELAEVNKQNSDTDCALGSPSRAEATSKPNRNDKSREEHMQSLKLQALSKEFAANMSTVNNILWEHSNELKQINNPHPDSELTALKRENLELKNQNKGLTDRISNLNNILADLLLY